MSLYCYVKDGGIGAPANLPQNYNNISNFYVLDAAAVATYGFYPFVSATKPAYDPATHTLQEELVFANDQVTQTWTLQPLTQEEQIAYATARLYEIGNQITPFLNNAVSRKQYESHVSARMIQSSNNPVWANEGKEAAEYYDMVWDKFESLKAEVAAGTTPLPTAEAWFASLPVLWPVDSFTGNSNNITANGTL